MKLLVDMNLSPSWVGFFESHRIASVHWSSVGHASAPDIELLTYAGRENLVIFTHDLDFGRMLVMDALSGPTVLQVRSQDVLPSAIGELVLKTLQVAQSYIEAGALITVDAERRRAHSAALARGPH